MMATALEREQYNGVANGSGVETMGEYFSRAFDRYIDEDERKYGLVINTGMHGAVMKYVGLFGDSCVSDDEEEEEEDVGGTIDEVISGSVGVKEVDEVAVAHLMFNVVLDDLEVLKAFEEHGLFCRKTSKYGPWLLVRARFESSAEVVAWFIEGGVSSSFRTPVDVLKSLTAL